jgi:uncharacterized membrane protein HdeD (DUF308 family)
MQMDYFALVFIGALAIIDDGVVAVPVRITRGGPEMSTLASPLSHYWWALVVRGLVAILFAILTFVWPGVTLGAIVVLFAVYALVDGAAGIVGGLKETGGRLRSWAPIVGGTVSVVAAIVTFIKPMLTLLALVTLIAIWAIVRGLLDIFAAIRLRKVIEGEWLLALGGAMSIVFGVLVFGAPAAGALVAAWWIALYALVLGLVLLVCGMKLRGLAKRIERAA